MGDNLFWFLVAPIVWITVGAGVLSLLDFEDRRYYQWYARAPFVILNALMLFFWPILAALIAYDRLRSRRQQGGRS